jgi:type 2 lantibiotic biosynthesis protein LanM
MTTPPLDHLLWYRATTLAERLAAGVPSGAAKGKAEDDLTRYRLQSWQSQSPFEIGSYFEQRLALDGLTETTLRELLAEPMEALRARLPEDPKWLTALVAVLSQPNNTDFTPLLSDRLKNDPTSGFLAVVQPFIARALERFDARHATLTINAASLPFDPSTIKKILFATLPGKLVGILSRTMALELNIARLSGELVGATPEARFQSFIARLHQPAFRQALLQEYPVLARLLLEHTEQWVSVSLEFLTRLGRDWPEIKATFADKPGVLVSVKGGITDTHRGGHSVFIAKFSAGLRLVYKPKSLGVDVHFQELLTWANEQGATPPFPTLKVLAREAYGWVEYVKARDCNTVEEVQRFYRRQGGYLALLYLLDATDFHAGNLIACGEFPYLIDLEALFHPHRNQASDAESADDLARRAMSHSVLRIGLLPERVWSNSESEGVDRSGLGTLDNQITPHPRPQWEEAGMDTMHLVRKRKPVRTDKNRPHLVGIGVNVLDYQADILAGFTATYSLLMQHRDELLADDSPLMRFAADEVCVFLRSMRTYRHLLRESYHPDVLHDALDRDRLFDLLWIEVEDDPDLMQIMRIERDDLWRGDIPLFTTRPASQALWINASEQLPDFFPESSLSIVRRRLQHFNQKDCERQAWFIQASLATLPISPAPSVARLPEGTATANEQDLRQAARAIGDRLEQLAFRGQEEAMWLGLTHERNRAWSLAACGLDLDAGLPGITLFLAYLGAMTEEPRYSALAQAAFTMMRHHLQEWGEDIELIGGFDGWGGIIYSLTQLGILWQRPDLIYEAEALLTRLPDLIEADDNYDLYGGAAGCIASLYCLAQFAPSDRVRTTAIQCGDHLLRQAQAMPEGIGWLPPGKQVKPEAGFVYGIGGIAWALLLLHNWTGLGRFRAAAFDAIRYERSLVAETTPDWTELGLARLGSLKFADDPPLQADFAEALAATRQGGFEQHQALYQGEAGRLELLLQASQRLGAAVEKSALPQFSATLLIAGARHGWRCGTPCGVETPGLLTGLAGIGYELLRLAEPGLVPSVLMLEPPVLDASSIAERSRHGAAAQK